MSEIGRGLIAAGGLLVAAGVVLVLLGRLGVRRLPGVLHYESQHVRIYFPIITCLILSALLTAGSMLWRWWTSR